MTQAMVYGGLGLLLGITVQAAGFSRREGVDGALALRHGAAVRTLLYLVGAGMLMTSALCWLAVIDVDLLSIAPLHSGVVLGGVLCGVAVGLSGRCSLTALCAVGGGRLLEALCCVAGCVAGVYLAPLLPVQRLQGLFSPVEGTLFSLTLRDPWLLAGGNLGLCCLGLLICCIALCVPMKLVHPALLDLRRLPAPPPEKDQTTQEAFVASLPEEEPMIVETAGEKRREPGPAKEEPIMQEHPELEKPPMPETGMMDAAMDFQMRAPVLPPFEEIALPPESVPLPVQTPEEEDSP